MGGEGRSGEYVPGFAIREGETVADVGCGEGGACVFAGELGAHVIGVDCDPIVIERLEARMAGVRAGSFRAVLSDGVPLPLAEACADVVICTEVIEHVADPVGFVRELVRIGKPGARYLISVPEPRSEELMRAVVPEWYWEAPYHLRVFEPEVLDRLLSRSGLEVERWWSGGFYWSMWWAMRMAMNPKPLEDTPRDGPTAHWEAAWTALGRAERGAELAEALDRVLPKSQMRIARKVRVDRGVLSVARGPAWTLGWWRKRLARGVLRMGGLEMRWQVRRARG